MTDESCGGVFVRKFIYDATRAEERRQALTTIADALMAAGVLPEEEVTFREGRMPFVVDGYFILNHAYKKWRIEEDHLTQNEKIAALTAMSIMTFRPFRPTKEEAKTKAQAKANEIFALISASSVIGANLKANVDNESNLMSRIIDIIAEAKSETLETYLVDKNFGIEKDVSSYDLNVLHKDRLVMNSLITVFELITRQR